MMSRYECVNGSHTHLLWHPVYRGVLSLLVCGNERNSVSLYHSLKGESRNMVLSEYSQTNLRGEAKEMVMQVRMKKKRMPLCNEADRG